MLTGSTSECMSLFVLGGRKYAKKRKNGESLKKKFYCAFLPSHGFFYSNRYFIVLPLFPFPSIPYCLFLPPSYVLYFDIPGRTLGHSHRDSRDDWYLYRRPSADDRRGFPKPGRCIKHNGHGVFPFWRGLELR